MNAQLTEDERDAGLAEIQKFARDSIRKVDGLPAAKAPVQTSAGAGRVRRRADRLY